MAFKTGGRKCKFESLESRQMLAGDVVGRVHAGTLTLKGDNLGNGITITAGANPHEVLVTGVTLAGQPTNVNAVSNGAITFVNVTKGLRVNMLGGNDQVTINNLTVNGATKINGGTGIDTIILTASTFCGTLTVQTGPGTDDVTATNVIAAGKANFITDGGCDSVTITNSNFGALNVHLGEANDSLSITNTQVITETALDGGKGINTFVNGQSNFFGGVYNKRNLAG